MNKKIIIKFFLFSVLFFSTINVLAVEKCTTSELKRLKELANNIEFKYEYEIIEQKLMDSDEYTFKQIYYDVTALNLTDELIVRLKEEENVTFTKDKPTINDFINGESVKIEMIAYTKNLCSGKTILTKILKLPTLNIYSFKEECEEYPDFKYCKENGEFNITDLKFQEELEEYKKTLENDDNKVNSNNGSFLSDLMPYIYIGIGLLVVIILIIVIINWKKKKDSDL